MRARDQLQAGKAALLAGDVVGAKASFRAAEASFIQADPGNPLLRFLGYLPLAGRTPDTVAAISSAGRDVARAGEELAETLAALPDGLSSLAPRDGTIPLAPFEQMAPGLKRAWVLARDAQHTLDAAPESWLLGSVADARARFCEELAQLETQLHAATLLADGLPEFLGANGARRYFLGASNPAELRGTGGFIGAYAILTADEGRIRISDFRPIDTLPNAGDQDVSPPNEDFGRRYPGVHAFWRSINLSPDFPSAGQAIGTLYEHTTGDEIDGVMVADPRALQALMRVAGGVDVPELGTRLTAKNVVPVLTNQAYSTITQSQERKVILGDAAKLVLERFLAGGTTAAQVAGAARALAGSAAGGHILLQSENPDMQRGLELTGAGGGLLTAEDDYLSVVLNNAAGNKLDYYAQRRVTYEVRLGSEGMARSEVSLELENTAPATGQPAYVIGPYSEDFTAGESRSIVSVFLAPTARLAQATVDGESFEPAESEELGHYVLDSLFSVPAGETGRMMLSTTVRDAWDELTWGGTYRLTLQGQPTLRPTEVAIAIVAPPGTSIVRSTPGMTVTDDRAIWRGVAPSRQTFEVDFQKPLLVRVWDALISFFGQKVVEF